MLTTEVMIGQKLFKYDYPPVSMTEVEVVKKFRSRIRVRFSSGEERTMTAGCWSTTPEMAFVKFVKIVMIVRGGLLGNRPSSDVLVVISDALRVAENYRTTVVSYSGVG